MIGCRPLTDTEINIIAKSLSTRDKTLFLLNLYTGFRIQESLSLIVSDVYSEGHVLDRVTVHRKNVKGKTAGRTLLIHPRAKKAIETLIKEEKLTPTDPLFKSKKGGPLGRVQAWRTLKAVVRFHKLEGKVALHSTRKVFAERMYSSFDKDIIKTSKALGHKNIMSTVSYLSFKTEELDEAILALKTVK